MGTEPVPCRNILLYVLDGVRSDHLGCYGYSRPTTPELDRFSRDAVLFERAYSVATWTLPSAATLLTGFPPWEHGVPTVRDRLPEGMDTLPEILGRRGYRTVNLCPANSFPRSAGLERGFDFSLGRFVSWDSEDPAASEAAKGNSFVFWAEASHRAYREQISAIGSGRHFCLIWNLETHSESYVYGGDPRFSGVRHRSSVREFAQWLSRGERHRIVDRYDDVLFSADRRLGSLLRMLRDVGLYDETLLIVTSDHGEELGEHGCLSHAQKPYEEQIRVPLLVKFPGSQGGGQRIDVPACHLDVFPTILSVAGIPIPRGPRGGGGGIPLIPETFVKESLHDRRILIDGSNYPPRPSFQAVVRGRWKLIRGVACASPSLRRRIPGWIRSVTNHPILFLRVILARLTRQFTRKPAWRSPVPEARPGRGELYNLMGDPEERNDVSGSHPEVVAEMETALVGIGSSGRREIPASLLRRMREMGYSS